MTEIEIFRTGTHTDMSGKVLTFAQDDLEGIARSYDPALHEAPLVIGHPNTDAPAYGWVKQLGVKGDRLIATAGDLDQGLIETVRAGHYRKVSPSFYPPGARQNPSPGKYYLRHVGLLGAKAPAVKGLKQVAFAGGEDDVIEFGETADDLRRYISEMERRHAQGDAAGFIKQMVREGRVMPRDRERMIAFMECLSGCEAVAFSEGDDEQKQLPAVDLFKQFVASAKPHIHFGEIAAPERNPLSALNFPKGRQVDPASLDLHQRAVTLQQQQGGSYAEAIRSLLGGGS